MTPANNQPDSKLLLSVAALVVAGVIGITLIAGLSMDEQVAEVEPAEPSYDPAPVLFERPRVAPATTAGFTPVVDPMDETSETNESEMEPQAGFMIDPDADLVQRGLESYEGREFDRAAAYFEAEAETRPDGAWVRYMLALSLWKSGAVDEAEQAMQDAAELDPSSIRSFVNLARIRNDLGSHDAALDAARTALEIDGVSATALFVEGRSLMNLGRYDEAVAALEASLERDPDNGHARNMLGLTLIRRGTPEQALPHLEQAARQLPQLAYVHNNRGMALELCGRAAEAVAAYRAGAELDPTHVRVAANLARLAPTLPGRESPPEGPQPTRTAQALADLPEVKSAPPIVAHRADGESVGATEDVGTQPTEVEVETNGALADGAP